MSNTPKPRLTFRHILGWLMVEVLFGRAHYEITMRLNRRDRQVIRDAMPLTRDAHADCAQLCAARIFDPASDASIARLLSAALAEAGTFKNATASDVRRRVQDAKLSIEKLKPIIGALQLRRNQTQAHTDARPIINPEQYEKAGRVSYREINRLFREVGEILNRFSLLDSGKSVPLDQVVEKYVQSYDAALNLMAVALTKLDRRDQKST